MTDDLKIIFDKYFVFLIEDYGYKVDYSSYDAESFGNFIIGLSKDEKRMRIVSGDKEDLLKKKGIPMTRFGFRDGLWDGHQIHNQVADIKKHRDILGI